MNRIDRLSAILIMLQSSLSVKPRQIMERFGIGIRTVYRDLRALEESGIPIAGDSRIGYSLVEGYKLPPLMFTQEEAFAFLAAEKLVDRFTDQGLRTSYKSGIDKIRAVMRVVEKETINTIDNKMGTLDFHLPVIADSYNHLQPLMDSVAKRYKIEITYVSRSKNETTVRTIDPIGVFFSRTNWYIIGFCNEKNDYRTFKVTRIQHIKQTSIPIIDSHPPLDTFLERLGTREGLQEIIIEVNLSDFSIIDENKYYQGLISEKKNGNKMELQFMTFSIERFARWYISYIDIAQIVFPEELKSVVKRIINKSTDQNKVI